MKKLSVLLMAAMMTLSLVACGGKEAEAEATTDAAPATEAVVEEATEAVVEEATEAVVEEVAAGVPVFQWDWDKLVFTFNEDGTFKMELPEYGVTEEGTWAIADGVLTLTSPSGKTYDSVIEDGVCKMNYTADASEQLVAQLYTSDYAFLDGAADVATAANVPAFTWDWEKLVFTFNEDGTFKMELSEYSIAEEGTWTMDAEGVVTVVSPAGNEFTSYVGEDGLVHLDYTADASEQLVAQLYIAE